MKNIASLRPVSLGWMIPCWLICLLAAAAVSHADGGTRLAPGVRNRVGSGNEPLAGAVPAMPAPLEGGLVCHLSFAEGPPPGIAEAPVSGRDSTGTLRYVLSGGAQAVVNGAFRPHSDHDLVLPHVPALSSPEELTLSAWFLLKSREGFQTLLYKGNRAREPERIEYFLSLRDGYPELKCKDAEGNWKGLLRVAGNSYGVPGLETVAPVGAGSWQHLAVCYERGMYAVYVNGKPVARVKRDMEALVTADDDLHIGSGESAQSGARSYLLDGLIDQVCIWRRALQAEEVAQLYDALAPAFASRGTKIPERLNPDLDAKFERKLALTAEYERNPPPGRVRGAGTRAGIQTHHGVPALHIDGRPVYAMLMMPGCYAHDGKDEDVFHSCRDFAAAGIDLYTEMIGTLPGYGCTGWWKGEGDYDFSIVDRRFASLLAANPNALVLPRVKLDPPKWWMESHPDDHSMYLQDGKPVSSGGYSIASAAWERASERMLRDFVRHVEGSAYAGHVFGYQPGGGSASEWHWYGQDKGMIDYSPAARDRFRQWLREKYGSDAALQAAWRRPDVTLNGAAFPSPATRLATECLAFRDPGLAVEYLNARRFLADTVARQVIRTCGIVKEETQGTKLAGVFYGYSLHFAGRSSFGNLANNGYHGLEQVLASPAVDFLSTPLEYGTGRLGGQPGNFVCPYTASIHLHNKLFFDEEDIRTYLYGKLDGNRAATRSETIAMFQRAAGWSLTKGNALWWFLLTGNATFHQEDLMRSIAALKKIGDAGMDGDKNPVREVAIFADEESLNYLADAENPLVHRLTWGTCGQAARMGAPHDLYLLQDIGMANLPDYKVYIFLNAFYTTPGLRRAIAAKVRRNHAVAVWLYAPGFVSEAGLGEESMRELTGLTLRHEVTQARRGLSIGDWTHPITARMQGSPGSSPKDLEADMGPFFWAEDPGARTLATCDGKAVLVVKEEKDFRTVYSAFPLTKELLQGICDYAGVHVYSRSWDVFFANQGFAMLHASSDGPRTILLPGRRTVRDLLTGQVVGRGIDRIETVVKKMETRLYRLDEVPPR